MKTPNPANAFTREFAVATHPAAAGTALVLAAHGSTRRPGANTRIEEHAETIRRRRIFHSVTVVFLTAEPDPATFSAVKNAECVLVVPFMMSDGYLTDEVVTMVGAGVAAPRHRILAAAPIGTLEHVGVIAAERAQAALLERGFAVEAVELLLVAHGSKGRPESKAAAEQHRRRLFDQQRFADVRLALLEEPPLLADALRLARGPSAVVGLFAAPGGHAVDDIRDAVQACERSDVMDAGAVGLDPRMADLAVIRAMQTLGS